MNELIDLIEKSVNLEAYSRSRGWIGYVETRGDDWNASALLAANTLVKALESGVTHVVSDALITHEQYEYLRNCDDGEQFIQVAKSLFEAGMVVENGVEERRCFVEKSSAQSSVVLDLLFFGMTNATYSDHIFLIAELGSEKVVIYPHGDDLPGFGFIDVRPSGFPYSGVASSQGLGLVRFETRSAPIQAVLDEFTVAPFVFHDSVTP